MVKQDPHNYRIHGEKNKQLIKKSIDELGAGRSVLVDSENVLIAGNGVMKEWGERPIKIIETDGNELIVVKRTDLKSGDEKRRKLAIVDNSASDLSEFDYELLKEDLNLDELKELGIELKEMEEEVKKEMQYDNSNCEYPLIPRYDENYSAFIIICKNKTEEARMRTKFNYEYKTKSYKNTTIAPSMIILSTDIK